MTTTPHLQLTDLVEGQKNAATAVNAAHLILDSMVQLWVSDGAPSTTPPTSGLVNGSSYVVPPSATGDWATHDLKITVWQSGWTFLVPRRGWRCWDARRNLLMIFTGEHGGGGRWMDFQAARVAELTDDTGGGGGTTLSALSVVYDRDEGNENFSVVNAQLNRIMDAMITAGMMTADALTAEVVNESITVAETTVDALNP